MSEVASSWPTVEDSVERIRARDREVRAFVWTRLVAGLGEAASQRTEPRRSALHGVPYSLKDLWDTAEIPTTGGSHRYRDRIPVESAPIHAALEASGAILLGKTNSADMGLSMESQSYVGGITKNPHDLARTAGGSSGGSAAAVADRMTAFDWGSDFGGSIRLPSAFCGVYGMRLSSEAWPVIGHFPAPPPSVRYLNGQGPIAASLDVMRTVLEVTAPRLRTGPTRRFELRGAQIYGPDDRNAGLWPTFASDVAPALARAAGDVRPASSLPPIARASGIARAMYASHLEDYLSSDTSITLARGIASALSSVALRGRVGRRTFHPRTAEMLLLIALGRATLYRDRIRAEREAALYREDVASVWDQGYVIAAPTTTYPAPRHGQALRHTQLASFVMPGNVADATGLAVPFGRFSDGMPRSLQLWGPPGSELELLALAGRLA